MLRTETDRTGGDIFRTDGHSSIHPVPYQHMRSGNQCYKLNEKQQNFSVEVFRLLPNVPEVKLPFL